MKKFLFIVTGLLAGIVAGWPGNTALADEFDAISNGGTPHIDQAPTYAKVFFVPDAATAARKLAEVKNKTDLNGAQLDPTVCTTKRECSVDSRYPKQGNGAPNRCYITFVYKPGGCQEASNRTAAVMVDGAGNSVMIFERPPGGGQLTMLEEVAPDLITPAIAQVANQATNTSAQINQLAEDQKATNQALLAEQERQRKQDAWDAAVTACEQRVDYFVEVQKAKMASCLNFNNNLANLGENVLSKDGLKVKESVGLMLGKTLLDKRCESRELPDKSTCSRNPSHLAAEQLASEE